LVKVTMAEWDGQPAGFALWFLNFSTWEGKPGIYLEDLFVRPAFRRNGIGKALLKHLAALAVEEGWTRFVWQVLDWNTPAIEFYEAQGARVMRSWITCRVEGDAIKRLAGTAD
jgi:diamine N-acetyltransferase